MVKLPQQYSKYRGASRLEGPGREVKKHNPRIPSDLNDSPNSTPDSPQSPEPAPDSCILVYCTFLYSYTLALLHYCVCVLSYFLKGASTRSSTSSNRVNTGHVEAYKLTKMRELNSSTRDVPRHHRQAMVDSLFPDCWDEVLDILDLSPGSLVCDFIPIYDFVPHESSRRVRYFEKSHKTNSWDDLRIHLIHLIAMSEGTHKLPSTQASTHCRHL